MRAVRYLPEGYREIFSVNLQKDKKVALFINALALLIAVAFAVPMHFYIPISALFDMKNGIMNYFLKFVCLFLSSIAYIFLHEFVHGIAMKCFGTKKIKYGFTGMYAFAGSSDYYNKKSYLVIAMAPIIVLGIILAIINIVVPYEWFWVIYLIQLSNISGAAGDLYVTVKFSKLPKDILINDTGIGMNVYSKSCLNINQKETNI